MTAFEWIVRIGMVKCFRTEGHDVRITPLVVLMARAAFRLPGTTSAMKATPIGNIARHFFVTVET